MSKSTSAVCIYLLEQSAVWTTCCRADVIHTIAGQEPNSRVAVAGAECTESHHVAYAVRRRGRLKPKSPALDGVIVCESAHRVEVAIQWIRISSPHYIYNAGKRRRTSRKGNESWR